MKGSALGRMGFAGAGFETDWAALVRQRRLAMKSVLRVVAMRADMEVSDSGAGMGLGAGAVQEGA